MNHHNHPIRNWHTPLWVWAFVLITHVSLAQTPHFVNYTFAEGLPSSEVYDLFQDSEGFIWIGTDQGVVRFDGFEMKVFTVKDGLTDPVVFGFSEDEFHRIWFRTYSGRPCYYRNGKIETIPWPEELQNLVQNYLVHRIYSEGDKLHISTQRDIITIDPDGRLTTDTVKRGILKVRFTEKGNALISSNGLSTMIRKIQIDDQEFNVIPTDTLHHNNVLCSLTDGDKLLVTINNDIFEYAHSKLKRVFTGISSIISLSKDQAGNYWIGYENHGVEKIDPVTYQRILILDFFNDRSVTRVIQDHEGGYWFSTLENGVFYSSNLNVNIIPLPRKSRAADFSSQYCVIGDQDGFVSLFDLTTRKWLWTQSFPSSVRHLLIQSNDELWVSASNTSVHQVSSGKLVNQFYISHSSLAPESDSVIWGVGGLRISKFDSRKGNIFTGTNAIHLKSLFVEPYLYASRRTGLDIFDQDRNLVARPQSLFSSKVTTLLPYNQDYILVGTIGDGFHLLNKHTFNSTAFNSENNFLANDIYTAKRNDSLIWLSTERGLVTIPVRNPFDEEMILPYQLRLPKETLPERINFIHFDDSLIWTVAENGIQTLPIHNTISTSRPIFYSEVLEPHSDSKVITLDYRSTFQMKFGFISFRNQNLFTRYRISATDPWTITDSRLLILQSLTPGDYTLILESSVDNQSWDEVLSLPITVTPPWWNTWLFRASSALGLLAAGLIFYRRRLNSYKERANYLSVINDQQKKLLGAEIEATERERTRIAKDLHDGVSIDLVAIKLMLSKVSKKLEESESKEIESQIQKTLADIKSIIYGLTPPGLELFGLSAGLQNYISILNKTSPSKITLEFIGSEIRDSNIGSIIFRIIQELITNSLKHAQCNEIAIRIQTFDTEIRINYQDNGIGFNPDSVTAGLGLSNIQSRVESLKGTLTLDSGSSGTWYQIIIPQVKTEPLS